MGRTKRMKKLYLKIRGMCLKTYFDYLHKKTTKEISKFPEFKGFHKISRYSRECIITEKIDGTNGLISIDEKNNVFAGSRNRWLWGSTQSEIHNDNHGFAKWVKENKEELLRLGKGYHYGEFWGKGIQRQYDLKEVRFSLFNVSKWADDTIRPKCCSVVPVLFRGEFTTQNVFDALDLLKIKGSYARPEYMNPEGIVIFHVASGHYYKKTIDGDSSKYEQTDQT